MLRSEEESSTEKKPSQPAALTDAQRQTVARENHHAKASSQTTRSLGLYRRKGKRAGTLTRTIGSQVSVAPVGCTKRKNTFVLHHPRKTEKNIVKERGEGPAKVRFTREPHQGQKAKNSNRKKICRYEVEDLEESRDSRSRAGSREMEVKRRKKLPTAASEPGFTGKGPAKKAPESHEKGNETKLDT